MPLVESLLDEGISVQLKFLEGEGDRDKVIAFTADGQELVSCHQVTGTMDFQHNRSVGMLRKNTKLMAEAIVLSLVQRSAGKAC